MEKITEIATSLINGNISDSVKRINHLSKLEFLNFIEEYSLLSGLNVDEVINQLKRNLN